MSNVIFVGWIRKGKLADCGETMKNQLLIKKLEELGVCVRQMDFKDWRKHPWVIAQLLRNIVAHQRDTLIFSTSAQNVYPLMRLMKAVGWKQNTIHWVIGGSLGQKVANGTYRMDIIGYMRHTLVESRMMKEQLDALGINGVREVPNFKPITYYPTVTAKRKDDTTRFVFLSRIMPEKGCDYILEAAKLLNEAGQAEKYKIDFYGAVAQDYKDVFNRKVSQLPNVNYCGFLNLRENSGYDMLAAYDVMLFPTYWKGEGLAGVFIDAFISGLPMIVTDWAHNRAFMDEDETAIFISVHNVVALREKMQECINGKYDLDTMAKNCQMHAERFNVDNVVTRELLKEIDII